MQQKRNYIVLTTLLVVVSITMLGVYAATPKKGSAKPLPQKTPSKTTRQKTKSTTATAGKTSRATPTAKKNATPAKQPLSSAAQQIAARQKELLSLQKSIAGDRKKIELLASKETATTQAIAEYQKHSEKIQRYVALLEEEIHSLQDKAEGALQQSNDVSSNLIRLRNQYSHVIRTVATKGNPSVQEMLVAPASQSDGVVEETIRRMTNHVSHTSRSLTTKRDSLAARSTQLISRSDMRSSLLAMKSNEQQALDRIIAAKQKALEKIRSDKKELSAQMKKKEQSAEAVHRLIAGMVAKEERSVKASIAAKPGSKPVPAKGVSATSPPSGLPSAGAMKPNSLPYPVASRKILHGFGTYRNPVTNTETNNPGIDISVPRGSGVSAVAGGVVSLVHWLPGYGSLVIVDHRNGFRSVYANLASVSVKQGQALTAGQNVGKSGESVDGEFLHLELWRERQRLNPASYLK